jgi:adenylyltransferase/sulfurtransferase
VVKDSTGDLQAELQVNLSESRYDRQERVSWWDQERLAAAKVLVVGAGALGNEVVKNLALVGVGHVVVVDLDVVETSNLARCIFFRAEDEGQPKASVLAHRASELNPEIEINGVVGDIRSFGTGIAQRADVIIGALDNREARLYCNRLAARVGKAWIDGAIEALSGVARVFEPPDTCYECTLTEDDWKNLAYRQSCRLLSRDDLYSGKVPTTASTSSIVAGLEVQEAVKLLHRDRPGVHLLVGAIVMDGANNDAYALRYPTDEDCLAHHRYDDLIPFTGSSATAQDVAEAAWGNDQGEGTPVIVELGDDHVVEWVCTSCNFRTETGRPAALIPWGESLCGSCGEPCQPTFLTSIEVPGSNAARTLAIVGVRGDEILAVRRGHDERFVWLSAVDERLPSYWGEQTLVDSKGDL